MHLCPVCYGKQRFQVMKQNILLFLLVSAGLVELSGQSISVWPGDANNNGVVNHVDLLQIGLAYNNIGPARDPVSSAWQAQSASPWPLVLGNGVNCAYADANGDGLVNYFYDAFPIYVHYGLRHGVETPDIFPPGIPEIDPPLYLDSSAMPAQVHSGAQLNLPILLGSAALPVEHLYGLAFSLYIDPEFVDVNQINVNLGQISWANPDNDRIYSSYSASDARLDVAWVRTDHNERSGYGPIGTLSIIIIDDVVSLEQDFMLRIDSIQMVDRFGNRTAVAGDSLLVTILPDAITSGQEPGQGAFRLWPNPARDLLYLKAGENIESAVLYDAMGAAVARIAPEQPDARWPLPPLPPGIYWTEVRTRERIYREKIAIK